MAAQNARFGTSLLAVLLLAIAASPTAGAGPEAAPGQVDHRLAAVHGAEARVADDLDRTVILRGVNVNGLGEYYQEWDDLPSTLPLTEDDFAQIAAHGFNVVRLLVSWSRLEPTPDGGVDTAYLDRIAATIEWARDHDVYVLLDMHQDAWSPFIATPDGVTCPPPSEPAVGWDGAPEWATPITDGPLTCRTGIREISFAVQAGFENFYLDVDGVQGHLVDIWAALAGRFAADPIVAGYDLLNEPNPGFTIGATEYALLGVFYDRALDAIRAAEAGGPGGFSHIGFFEPGVITGPLALPGPLPGFTDNGNLVYAPHLYNESISPLPGTIEDGFANVATAAANYGTTFFSGEWGWFGDSATDAPAIARYAAQEDAYLVGGTWWQWEQACGDPHAIPGRGVRPGCAGVSPLSDGLVTRSRENTIILDRAYPRAAPGVLGSIDADIDSGALTISGTASRTDTAADLWVPGRCAEPAVSGTNIGDPAVRAVPGGWRLAVPIPSAGDYRIAVSCAGAGSGGPEPPPAGAPAASESSRGDALPATGGPTVPALAVLLVAAAVAATGVLRAARTAR